MLLVSILRKLSKLHATRRSGSSSKKGSKIAKGTELNGSCEAYCSVHLGLSILFVRKFP